MQRREEWIDREWTVKNYGGAEEDIGAVNFLDVEVTDNKIQEEDIEL